MRRLLHPLSFLLLAGCLRVPPSVGPDGAPGAPDAGPSAPEPLAIRALTVRDRGGAEWPAEGAPRWPVLALVFSEPLFVERDETPPLGLFAGPADDDLIDDLSAAPLRIATRERQVPAAISVEGATWTIRPDAPLAPGARVTVAVGTWAEAAARGQRLAEPWTAEVVVSDAPEAGARVTDTWPADGAAAVAPAIAELAVRFDGPVEGVADGIALLDGDRPVEASVEAAPCPALGFDGGWCARLVPGAALARGAPHRLVIAETVRDATGAPVGPFEARFTTATEPDREPPRLSAGACALDEAELPIGCLFTDDASFTLRFRASEPVRAELTVAGRTLRAVAPRGEARLGTDGLPSDEALDAVLRVTDAAGRESARALTIRTTPPLAAVSLVEVRADPNGPEPRQEYVEVLNWGAVTVDLHGFSLSDRVDREGDRLEGPAALAPGQRALLVADGFDPEDPADPPVPPGVPLIRLGRSIAGGGLSNAGEPLYLRDPEGHRISASPGVPAPDEGACLVRVGDRMRAGDAAAFEGRPCTPGTADR